MHLQQERTEALLRAKILLLGLQLRPHVLPALPFSHPDRDLAAGIKRGHMASLKGEPESE